MDEISKYIDANKEVLKEKNISFNYSKITPGTLIGIDEYNDQMIVVLVTVYTGRIKAG